MNSDRSRYGYQFAEDSYIPCVEITSEQNFVRGEHDLRRLVVKTVYGFTPAHALRRAFRWMAEQGDPRYQ